MAGSGVLQADVCPPWVCQSRHNILGLAPDLDTILWIILGCDKRKFPDIVVDTGALNEG